MNRHIGALEGSGLIVDGEGPWSSLLILAPKPHQEDCNSIDNFIWRLCDIYRALNTATRIFEYSISRCTNSIEDCGDSCGFLKIIFLDARSGYHQISIRLYDGEKALIYYLRQNENVHNHAFGPKKSPVFYTTMMQFLREDWLLFFTETKVPYQPVAYLLL